MSVFLISAIAHAVAPDVRKRAPETELFAVDVGPLVAKFDKSHIVSDPEIIQASFYQMDSTPRVVVPDGAEAYLLKPETSDNNFRGYRIVGKKPVGAPISGSLYLLRRHPDHPRESTLAKFMFDVDAQPSARPSSKEFFLAKGRHFQRLWSEEMAGSAMFRHLAMTSLKEAGETARSTGPNWPLRRNTGVDSTIALMSGGRAVSENLQLDTQLAIPDEEHGKLKPLSGIRGITIREIDWDDLLKEGPTELDPLAQLVPHNQYAVYLPSFQALADVVDRGGEVAQPAVQWFEPQSRKTDVMSFYQTQLALPLNTLTRQVGKALIGEVAVTGSDPYFRTGTDIAILMSSDQPKLLQQSIMAQVVGQSALHQDVKRVEHRVDQHEFTEWSTENRKLSSFVARVEDAVVVSNSLHQMLQVLRTADGRVESMYELDEYRFFRQRYPRADKSESALVVVTDAAIRRWCSPQWRIAASRRTRARATIAEVTMQHADDLVRQTLTGTTKIHSVAGMPQVGGMLVSTDGVYSERYGTLDFQTPIAEMDMSRATDEEIKLYEDWRNRYERRWRRAFDPIALQLKLKDDSISADLSVIPLMIRSEYQQYTQFIGNVRLGPSAGDPHPEMLADFTIAVDTNAPMLQFARMMIANGTTDFDLLAWIDGSATMYFDFDPEWINKFDKRSPWDMSPEDFIREIPIGFFIPSKDNLRMTAFVVAIRSALQRFSPNMFQWETIKHGEFEYVMGTVIQGTPVGQAEDMPRIYYVTTSKGLTISANRGVVQRVIDRHLVNKKPHAKDEPDDESKDPHKLQPQLIMQATGKGAEIMTRTNYRSGLRRMNRIAWSNIPILNYLRSRYPDRDPHKVYSTLFGQTLMEPSGGEYVWDADLGTYVSSLQGYHLQPKAGPAMSPVLGPEDRIKTTISFQDRGLRATLNIEEN